MMPIPAPLLRHVFQATALIALCHVLSIYTIDSPKQIYHCPLDRNGLSHLWADENCYWSNSYVEAREKFVSLGNHIKEQARNADADGAVDVIDVQSLSYDIAHEDFPEYVKSLESLDVFSPQSLTPGKDTIDALLLTVRIPAREGGDDGDGDGENVNIIHSSGTHGVEGYLGSAVQIRFLHELFVQNEKKIKDKPLHATPSPPSPKYKVRKLLLIHAVNPYGMRHHRRTNENNVDLNRNVLSDEVWSEIRKRDPNFVGYVEIDSELNPFQAMDEDGNIFSWVEAAKKGGYDGEMTKLHQQDEKAKNVFNDDGELSQQQYYTTTSLKGSISFSTSFSSWLDEQKNILGVFTDIVVAVLIGGYTNRKRTLVASQYHKPSGIFYGGGAHNDNKWENSIFAIQHAINEFAGFRQFESSSSRTLWVDVHTGLGDFGDYSILIKNNNNGSDNLSSSPDNGRAWTSKFTSLLDASGMGYGQSSDAGVSLGYDQSAGFVTDQILCPPPHCFSLTQEFGTRPGILVAVALILENKGFHAGNGQREYGYLTSWAFYPQRLSWRRKALRGGMDMMYAILDF